MYWNSNKPIQGGNIAGSQTPRGNPQNGVNFESRSFSECVLYAKQLNPRQWTGKDKEMIDKAVFQSLLTVDRLEQYVRDTLPQSKYGKFVCPFCNSGEKEHHTGEFSINRKDPSHGRWNCFSCNKHGDIFDLIAKVNGITGSESEIRAESIKAACSYFGLEYGTGKATKPSGKATEPEARNGATNPNQTQTPSTDGEGEKVGEITLYTDYLEYAYQNGRKSLIVAFEQDLQQRINTPLISTGFPNLDKLLGGGLCEGLYTIGGISSVGKTSFVLQVADSIAESGEDVLYFSLEMSKFEMLAKTLSRKTYILSGCELDNPMARTVRDLTVASRWKDYTKKQLEIIKQAEKEVEHTAGEVYVFEGIGTIGISTIRKTVKDHIALTGRKPVVIIDYGQILAPYNIRATDKQNTDYSVLEAKRMSRDEKVPVIWISSFNRQSYHTGGAMEAFKDTGGIEYTSDVLIALQLKGEGEKNFDQKQQTEAKKRNPREVEAVILKNRNGELGTVNYDYVPKFNYFIEGKKE